MPLSDVITSFYTGTYKVTRTGGGSFTNGVYALGTTSTFDITASIQPVTGRDLQVLPEGQHANETKVVYTTTELKTRDPSNAGDKITINGEAWEVFRVERWEAFGLNLSGDHYRAFVSRLVTP
jgi:hypothetical protein